MAGFSLSRVGAFPVGRAGEALTWAFTCLVTRQGPGIGGSKQHQAPKQSHGAGEQ